MMDPAPAANIVSPGPKTRSRRERWRLLSIPCNATAGGAREPIGLTMAFVETSLCLRQSSSTGLISPARRKSLLGERRP